ncbi:hypothetical protein F4859DRAFT_478590 [Xylaria cf. heliscus]|nr:hypothetical protein F4859DRAFT_478590 [Xylaria cf. heliscus]
MRRHVRQLWRRCNGLIGMISTLPIILPFSSCFSILSTLARWPTLGYQLSIYVRSPWVQNANSDLNLCYIWPSSSPNFERSLGPWTLVIGRTRVMMAMEDENKGCVDATNYILIHPLAVVHFEIGSIATCTLYNLETAYI